MDYYQILGISFTDNTRTIKKHYYKLAKQYHPDKFSGDPKKCEEFKTLSEAYSTLSNPKKRYIYDIQRVADFFDLNLNLQLTDDELDLLYTYYQDICNSVEFRLFYTIFQSFPHKQTFWKNISRVFRYTRQSVSIPPKSIDCQNLDEDFTIHLFRDLQDVYENVAKEILIITKSHIYRIFVTHSDYTLYLPNQHYTLTIAIETKSMDHILLNGHDIHLTVTRDLYQYFFESSVITTFLKQVLTYDPQDLNTKYIAHGGLKDPETNRRGTLVVHNKIIYHMDMKIAHNHIQLLKTILSKA
jgi:DnaJ-class molecular chaperone